MEATGVANERARAQDDRLVGREPTASGRCAGKRLEEARRRRPPQAAGIRLEPEVLFPPPACRRISSWLASSPAASAPALCRVLTSLLHAVKKLMGTGGHQPCVSSTTDGVEHLFTCLLLVRISSLEKCPGVKQPCAPWANPLGHDVASFPRVGVIC